MSIHDIRIYYLVVWKYKSHLLRLLCAVYRHGHLWILRRVQSALYVFIASTSRLLQTTEGIKNSTNKKKSLSRALSVYGIVFATHTHLSAASFMNEWVSEEWRVVECKKRSGEVSTGCVMWQLADSVNNKYRDHHKSPRNKVSCGVCAALWFDNFFFFSSSLEFIIFFVCASTALTMLFFIFSPKSPSFLISFVVVVDSKSSTRC